MTPTDTARAALIACRTAAAAYTAALTNGSDRETVAKAAQVWEEARRALGVARVVVR